MQPILDRAGYQRVLASRNVYAEAATYVWKHPPPPGIEQSAWLEHGEVCRRTADRLDKVLTAWERENAYR